MPLPPAGERIKYGDLRQQFGELRVPVGEGPFPVIVLIHGGCWQGSFDYVYITRLAAWLTERGVATWTIEYRRLGDDGGGWPGTFRDVAAGAAHLFAVAPEHRIDPGAVAVLGHSAGGHLALWLAGSRAVPPASPIRVDPLPFRGAVALASVLDLNRAWELGLSDGAVADLLGGGPDERPDRYAAASPAALLPLGVPQLLVHGADDDIVPPEISRRYHDRARTLGDDPTLLDLPGTDHFEVIDPEFPAWPRIAAAVSSLVRP